MSYFLNGLTLNPSPRATLYTHLWQVNYTDNNPERGECQLRMHIEPLSGFVGLPSIPRISSVAINIQPLRGYKKMCIKSSSSGGDDKERPLIE